MKNNNFNQLRKENSSFGKQYNPIEEMNTYHCHSAVKSNPSTFSNPPQPHKKDYNLPDLFKNDNWKCCIITYCIVLCISKYVNKCLVEMVKRNACRLMCPLCYIVCYLHLFKNGPHLLLPL